MNKSSCHLFNALAIGLVLAACGRSGPPATPESQDNSSAVVLTFATLSLQQRQAEELSQQFTELHPNITIEVRSVEELLPDSVSSSWEMHVAALATAVDVFVTLEPDPLVGNPARYVLDLRPFIDTDRSFASQDFFPGVLERFRREESILGVPSEGRLQLMFYRLDLFDAPGIPRPQPDWTWADFERLARALTIQKAETSKQYGFADRGGVAIIPFLHGQRVALTNPQAIKAALSQEGSALNVALQQYASLAHDGIMPGPGTPDALSLDGIVESGQVAMWPGLAGERQGDESPSINAVPFPEGTGAFFFGYYVSAQIEHPQAAWQWLRYLSLNSAAQGTHRLPVRRSLAEGTDYWERVGAEATAIRAALAAGFQSDCVPMTMRGVLIDAARAACGNEAMAQHKPTAQPRVAQGPAQPQPSPMPVPLPSFSLSSEEPVEIKYCGKKRYDQEIAKTFNAAQNQIQVKMATPGARQMPGGMGIDISSFIGPCDCFSWYETTAEGVEKGFILNLQPLVDTDPEFSTDDFVPQAIEAFRWQGDLWGLPATVNPTLIYYNKTLFDQAGVPYPRPDWRWDDFLNTAHQLTQGEGDEKQYGFVDLMGLESGVLPFITQHGGQIVDTLLSPEHPTLDSPLVVEGVQWYFDLASKYGVMPMPLSPDEGDSYQTWEQRMALVGTGKTAMWSFSAWWPGQVPGLKPAGPLVGVVPMPRDAQSATTFYFLGFYISASTPHPEACWVWLRYLSQHLPPDKAAPARLSLIESREFRQQVGQQMPDAILASVGFVPSLTHNLAVSSAVKERALARLQEALLDIAQGADVEAASQDAQRAAEQDLAESRP